MPASFDGFSDRPCSLAIFTDTELNSRSQLEQQSSRPHGPTPPMQLGLVAVADLLHLDARVQGLRQVAHQIAEVDALLGEEVEDHLRAVEDALGA